MALLYILAVTGKRNVNKGRMKRRRALWNESHFFTVVTRLHARTACVCLRACVPVQIVLGRLDPSQSEWSCLGSSALDPSGALIRPDSWPQEMIGQKKKKKRPTAPM